MSTHHRTPKSVYITLAAGIAIGALAMAGVSRGVGVTPAQAQTPDATAGFAPRTISSSSAESLSELHNLDSSMANLAEFVAPAVVHITSVNERKSSADGKMIPINGGQGSGFIFRPDGWIVTNDHVVGGFDKVTVILKDGREFKGTVRRAEDSDVALVKIDANDLPTLAFADSEKVRPGQISMAIGAPFGLDQSVTVGHVSALGRVSTIENKLYPDLIQTDTAINMGNSGGPLVNIDGQVIGINTAIFSPTGVSGGIGFAIPANQARMITDILMKDGKLTRSMLKLIPDDLKEYQKKDMDMPNGGALVQEVQSDGPAAAAGIKKGDVIVRIGDTPVKGQLDLRNAMLIYHPGTTVPVEVVRNKQHLTLNVKLIGYEAPKVPTQPDIQQMPDMPGSPDMPGMPRDFNDFRKWFKDLPDQGQPGAPDLQVPQSTDKPKLGVNISNATDELRKQYHIPASSHGAVVVSVVPGSIAYHLGMKSGDVITKVDNQPIKNSDDLIATLKGVKAGDHKQVAFTRYSSSGTMSMSQTVTF